jgi:hypothetical protein
LETRHFWGLRGRNAKLTPPGATFADILMIDQYELGTAQAMEIIIGHIPFSRHFLEKNLGLKEPPRKTLLVVSDGCRQDRN